MNAVLIKGYPQGKQSKLESARGRLLVCTPETGLKIERETSKGAQGARMAVSSIEEIWNRASESAQRRGWVDGEIRTLAIYSTSCLDVSVNPSHWTLKDPPGHQK